MVFMVSGSNYGIVGSGGTYGVYGYGTSAGVYAVGGTYGLYSNGSSYGLYSYSTNGWGGYAVSDNSDGFDASTTNGYYGIFSSSGYYMGVYGTGPSYGTYGYSSGGYGATGSSYSGYGVYGSSTNSYGGYFYSSSSYGLRAGTSGFYAGVFDGNVWTSGAYYTSDKNLKKNIKDVSNAMDIIRQLKPKNYEFKDEAKFKSLSLPKGSHYGLLAQEVEEVLPNLVHSEKRELDIPEHVAITPEMHEQKGLEKLTKGSIKEAKEVMDIKAVNYNELIPIMIKAMQEQDAKIEKLTNQLEKIMEAKGITQTGTISSASISQNIPNPAANITTINYSNLPVGASSMLTVNDSNGKLIKQIQLTGNTFGTIKLDVATLINGTYSYSLIVDGKIIDTKKMELLK